VKSVAALSPHVSVPVSYHCPSCGTVVELPRDGYLADKAVTPYPLEGWTYVDPGEVGSNDGEATVDDDPERTVDDADADGVRFVCGESDGCSWDGGGCGEPFYLSFVRFEGGREVEPTPESERVELGVGPDRPRGPDAGPSGPNGPGGLWR
jgi:hypothetical protein